LILAVHVQAAELAAQLQILGAEKAEVASALEALQAQHTAATKAAAEAAATAAQALSQLEAQKASMEERVVELTVTAQEHAKYQQELEGMATVPSSTHTTWPPAICHTGPISVASVFTVLYPCQSSASFWHALRCAPDRLIREVSAIHTPFCHMPG